MAQSTQAKGKLIAVIGDEVTKIQFKTIEINRIYLTDFPFKGQCYWIFNVRFRGAK